MFQAPSEPDGDLQSAHPTGCWKEEEGEEEEWGGRKSAIMLVLITSSGPFINQTRVEVCVVGANIDHCHAALHVHNRPSDRGGRSFAL